VCSRQAALLALALLVVLSLAGKGFANGPHIAPGTGLLRANEGESQCLSCHLPGEAGVPGAARLPSQVGAAPAWQPSAPAPYTFATAGIPPVGGSSSEPPSLLCLACHNMAGERVAGSTPAGHPYRIPYGGYAGSLRLRPSSEFWPAQRSVVENRVVWSVPVAGRVNKLPLYVMQGPLSAAEAPSVECTTCHDPHSSNRLLLRATAEEGGLCLSCHVK
jgi:predicted CXXCH cytochrome family protein